MWDASPHPPTEINDEEIDNLQVLLQTCNVNIALAQNKIDEQIAELTVLRDSTTSKLHSIKEIADKKKNNQEVIEAAVQKMTKLQDQDKHNRSNANQLNVAIEALKVKLVGGPDWTEEQQKIKIEILEKIDAINRSIESKNTLSLALRSDINKLLMFVGQQEAEIEEGISQIETIQAQIKIKREKVGVEQHQKVALEQRLQMLQLEMEQRATALMRIENRARAEGSGLAETEMQLRESKKEMERYLKDYERLFQETQHLTEFLESLMYSNETTESENEVLRHEINLRELSINALATESAKVAEARDLVQRRISAVEKQRGTWEAEREHLRERTSQLSNVEIRMARREGETYKKQLENIGREREILARKLGSSEKTAQLILDLTKVNKNAKKNLQNEVNGYTSIVKLQREKIEALVQDHERHEQEANSASRKYYMALEQLKLQEAQMSGLQRKIIDGSSRLKQQQNLYEAVRSERNLYSKNLLLSQEEILGMRQRFKTLNHQIDQLKEEITVKDHSLVKEHFNHHNVDKERELLKNELTKIKKQVVSSEQMISRQRAEIQQLSQIIREADEERQRQHKEHDAIVGERNILSSQLIRRNEELAAVYEKIKINWSSLQCGEARYAERATEVQFLADSIEDMQAERNDSVLQMTSISDLRNARHALETDLLQERSKIKALQEELQRPLNVHRWRMLESSDPRRYEMLKKVQGLQKNIIKNTEKVIEKEVLIQDKEHVYVELKNILGRQPGREVSEQLCLYQANLREKRAQMKAMTEELDMYKQQVVDFRGEIDNIACDIENVKEEWIRKQLGSV